MYITQARDFFCPLTYNYQFVVRLVYYFITQLHQGVFAPFTKCGDTLMKNKSREMSKEIAIYGTIGVVLAIIVFEGLKLWHMQMQAIKMR